MSIPEMQRAAIAHLNRQQTKCIIFDEAHHAIRGNPYEVANFFKHILNVAKVNIVLAGLPNTADLLDNEQLEGRGIITAELRAFDWWDADDKRVFLGVLKKLQGMVRFPVLGFDFFDTDWAWRFAYGSRGLMRPIVKLLVRLEVQAEKKESPSITADMLKVAWDKLAKNDRVSGDNPFQLVSMPTRWKPAHSRAGERLKEN